MRRSTDRILTTHTGSLPRPADLVALLNDKEAGKNYDKTAFDQRIRRAVSEIVGRQTEQGIDVVNGGEHSKVSWMAHARARLGGLEEIDSPVRFRGATRSSRARVWRASASMGTEARRRTILWRVSAPLAKKFDGHPSRTTREPELSASQPVSGQLGNLPGQAIAVDERVSFRWE
jgi:hypothetical protein